MANELEEAVKSAANGGDVAALKRLVTCHGEAAVRADADAGALTALPWAAGAGHLEAVRFLLAPPVSADPTAARINNFTPLHSAAMQGHAAVCELLLDAGASVNAQTAPQAYSPLHRHTLRSTALLSAATLRLSECCWHTERTSRYATIATSVRRTPLAAPANWRQPVY